MVEMTTFEKNLKSDNFNILNKTYEFYVNELGIKLDKNILYKNIDIYFIDETANIDGQYNPGTKLSNPSIFIKFNENGKELFAAFVHEYGHHIQYILKKIDTTPFNPPFNPEKDVHFLINKSIKESFTYFSAAYALASFIENNNVKPAEVLLLLSSALKVPDSSEIMNGLDTYTGPSKILNWLENYKKSENQENMFNFKEFKLPLNFDFGYAIAEFGISFAIIAFEMNNFNIQKTANFLFRPWDKILEDMIKIAKHANNNEAKENILKSMKRRD